MVGTINCQKQDAGVHVEQDECGENVTGSIIQDPFIVMDNGHKQDGQCQAGEEVSNHQTEKSDGIYCLTDLELCHQDHQSVTWHSHQEDGHECYQANYSTSGVISLQVLEELFTGLLGPGLHSHNCTQWF